MCTSIILHLALHTTLLPVYISYTAMLTVGVNLYNKGLRHLIRKSHHCSLSILSVLFMLNTNLRIMQKLAKGQSDRNSRNSTAGEENNYDAFVAMVEKVVVARYQAVHDFPHAITFINYYTDATVSFYLYLSQCVLS